MVRSMLRGDRSGSSDSETAARSSSPEGLSPSPPSISKSRPWESSPPQVWDMLAPESPPSRERDCEASASGSRLSSSTARKSAESETGGGASSRASTSRGDRGETGGGVTREGPLAGSAWSTAW